MLDLEIFRASQSPSRAIENVSVISTVKAAWKGTSKVFVITFKTLIYSLLFPKTPLGAGKLIYFPTEAHHMDILPRYF